MPGKQTKKKREKFNFPVCPPPGFCAVIYYRDGIGLAMQMMRRKLVGGKLGWGQIVRGGVAQETKALLHTGLFVLVWG